MVEYTPQGSNFSLSEYGVIEKNLMLVAHPRFRAGVVKAMHDCIRQQVRQRVRMQVAGSNFETPRIVTFSPEMSEQIIEKLRGAAFDEARDYVVARPALQHIVRSYDESLHEYNEQRREHIVAAEHMPERTHAAQV